MNLDAHRLIGWPWVAVCLYWLVTSLQSKPVAKRESYLSRARHIAIMCLACWLLWENYAYPSVLNRRFVPDEPWIAWLGLFLTVAGCAFAIWARIYIGSNWSATVTVKENHQLILRGPYAVVRHPIYAGFLLAMAGTALVIGEVRAALGVAVALLAFLVKSSREEQFMREQFNGEYVRYSQRVRRLIPFVL